MKIGKGEVRACHKGALPSQVEEEDATQAQIDLVRAGKRPARRFRRFLEKLKREQKKDSQ
jgi:hypothetical protein